MYVAITLFTLAEGRSKADYEEFARTYIGPRMRQMPSVTGFRDGLSRSQMGGAPADWDGLEIIQITSPEEFEADHEVDPGKETAATWNTWVDRFEVTYFELIDAPQA